MVVVDLAPEIGDSFGGIGLKKQAKSNSEARGSELVPINLRLQEKNKFTRPPLKPRGYQVELCQHALAKNTIIYLGTGQGKTFIVVMMLKSPHIDEQIRQGRRAIFLAPTQDLVKQQAEYIYSQVPYKVKVYCGRTCNTGLHIDNWNQAIWDEERQKYELLFMTPAILNQALAINALNWKDISLVIFDECHHAATTKKERSGKKSGSPYSQILKHYRNMYVHSSGPPVKFVGLTASLINNMPKGPHDIELGVADLESKLYALCVTDLSAIESKPKHVIWTYEPLDLSNDNDTITSLLHDYAKRYEDALELAKAKKMVDFGPQNEDDKRVLSYHNRLRMASSGFSIKPGSFHKVLRQIAAIRKGSGIWTMANICFNLAKAMESHGSVSFISDAVRPVYIQFGNILRKILIAIYDLVGQNYSTSLFDYSSPKLMCLLEVLKTEHERMVHKTGPKETFSCIVFVKSRVEVVAVCSWLINVSEHIAGYEFIKANYAIGLSATAASKWACITRRKSTEQSLMLDDFRRGRLNVIVTTSVLEEGIDLPVCSTIIRYDTADTFRVYVQSRGRARQQESSYIILSERTKESDARKALNSYNDFEERIKEVLKSSDQSTLSKDEIRAPRTTFGGDTNHNKEEVFKDEANQIYMPASIARVVLHMYCAKLSRRNPYSVGLQFKRREVGQLVQTTLYFPPGCPIKDSITGRERETIELANSSAVIAAFEALYRAGELDKNGVPVRETEEHIDELLNKHNMEPKFNLLDQRLEGELLKVGENHVHLYPWKLCQLTSSSVYYGSREKRYKLFKIKFVAYSEESVRKDTYQYFSRSAYGMIVNATFEQSILPTKIFSHYGTFQVEYQLIDDNLKIDNHADNNNYFNYTFRLIKTFWNQPSLQKDAFADRCVFYLAPLDESNNVDWARLRNAFYPDQSRLEPGDVVRLNKYHSNHENCTKRFVVHEIREDLNPQSVIPRCRETFLERARQNGHTVREFRQPAISVWPISREFGKTSQGKLVRSDDCSQLVFYLEQYLERVKCDPHEAYQAYNIPEIVYRVYLDSLGSEFETQFLRATANARGDDIVPEAGGDPEKQSDLVSGDANGDDANVSKDDDFEANDNRPVERAGESDDLDGPDEEIDSADYASDLDYSDDSDSESEKNYDSSDSDAPAPANKYLDILARQEYNLIQGEKSGPEKWDLSEYDAPNIKQHPLEHVPFYHSSKNVDSDSRASSIRCLPADTIIHQLKIEEVLRNFKKGILGDADYQGEDQDYRRPNCQVDLSIDPPIHFDKKKKPIKDAPLKHAFIEALTTRKAGDETNLEGLENIGDSYIKYCISVVLFLYLDLNEGLLTSARSRLVGNKHFYHRAKENKLGYYSITNKFDREILSAALGSAPACKNRLRQKDMADMFESLVGACLVHKGEHEAILAMKWLGLGHVFRRDTFFEFHKDAVVFARPPTPSADKENWDLMNYLRQCKGQLKKFQAIIKYDFGNETYLVQAFTHASAFTRCTDSYERLEFLGDAILDFLITLTLYNAGITKDPGQLTCSRSALVNNCSFAKLAVKYNYDVYIQHANQQLFDELHRVNESAKSDQNLEFLDMVEFDRVTKCLADVFEAVAGAIYLDSGCSLDTVYSIYYPMMKELIDAEIQEPTKNVMSQLYEMFPGFDRIKFECFKTTVDEGEDSIDCAKCTIFGLDKEFLGEGLNKKQARKRAAEQVMKDLPPRDVIDKLNAEWKADAARGERPSSRGNRRGGGSRGRGRGGGRGGGGFRRDGQRSRPPPRRY